MLLRPGSPINRVSVPEGLNIARGGQNRDSLIHGRAGLESKSQYTTALLIYRR